MVENNTKDNSFNLKLKNTLKVTWQSKTQIDPEEKDLDFQIAEMVYSNKDIQEAGKITSFFATSPVSEINFSPNKLIWGDNLLIMQALLSKGYEGKFDLIYIDPPFNTGEDFNFPTNVTIEQTSYKKELNMIERLAYTDTWERGMDSFLDMLYPRLKLMRRLLDDSGAIFVHCDYHVEHGIKLLMDEIFGANNFRNQIFVPRIKKNVQEHETSKKLNVALDTVLFFAKSESNRIKIPTKHDKKPERWHGFEADGIRGGMDYELFGHRPNPGNHWRWKQERAYVAIESGQLRPNPNTGKPEYKIEASEETTVSNLWDDINAYSFSHAYPTEKNVELLKRIIEMCSRTGELVGDFFCGSGTTCIAAEETGRKWIGADLSKVAIHVTRNRLIEKQASIFTIENLGNYQRNLIYLQGFNLKFANSIILKLFGATQITNLIDVGMKNDDQKTLVLVSSPDRPLTARSVLEKAAYLSDLDNARYKNLIVLAWDYQIRFDEQLSNLQEAIKSRLNLSFKKIPDEIYQYLKKIDLNDTDKINSLKDKIKFYDKPYLSLSNPKIIDEDRDSALVQLKINRYNILDIPIEKEDLRQKFLQTIKNNFAVMIDYYAVDWDYDKMVFKSQQQNFAGFGRKRKIINTVFQNRLTKGKTYKIVVRAVDVFGNDSEALAHINLTRK